MVKDVGSNMKTEENNKEKKEKEKEKETGGKCRVKSWGKGTPSVP